MNLSLYQVLQALTFTPTFTEDTLEKKINNVREEGMGGGGWRETEIIFLG